MNYFKKSAAVLVALSLIFIQTGIAEAAALTGVSETLSSLSVSTNASHVWKFTTPTGVPTSGTVIITASSTANAFNFTGAVFGDVTITWGPTTGLENATTTAASNSATAWGVAFTNYPSTTTNGVMTLTAPSGSGITAGSKVIVTLASTHAVNPSVVGSYSNGITGSFGDVGTSTVNIISNGAVSVSGTVAQSISFSISANTISFGTLDPTTAHYASTTGQTSDTLAHNLIVATNAPSGYTLTLKGATLTSQQNPSNTITAITGSAAASSVGTMQFGIYATSTTGTVVTNYAGLANKFYYGATGTTADTLASNAGVAAGDVYNVHYLANITTTAPAGTYSSNIIYVATANF